MKDGEFETFVALAFSPDGKRLASGSRGHNYLGVDQESSLCLWDTSTGQKTQRALGTNYGVSAVAFSHDGTSVAFRSGDDELSLMDVKTGKTQMQWSDRKKLISRAAFAPDGKTLAWGNWKGELVIWDLKKNQLRHRIPALRQPIDSMSYSRDSKNIVTGGEYQTPRIWDVASGKATTRIDLSERAVWHGAFSAGDKTMVMWGGDVAIHLWDLNAKKEILVGDGHGHRPRQFSVSVDNATVATASFDGAFLWDLESGRKKVHIPGPNGKGFWSASIAPDGKTLAAGDGEGFVRVYEIPTGREIRNWKTAEHGVFTIAFAPDGKTLYSAGWFLIQAWEYPTGKIIRQMGERPPPDSIRPGRNAPMSDLNVSPDGKTLLVSQGRLRFWKTDSGAEVSPKVIRLAHAPSVFSPDGKVVLTQRTMPENGWVTNAAVWEIGSEKATELFARENTYFTNYVFSPKGKFLAVADRDRKVTLREFPTGKIVKTFRARGSVMAFTPSGRFLAVNDGPTDIVVYDVAQRIKE